MRNVPEGPALLVCDATYSIVDLGADWVAACCPPVAKGFAAGSAGAAAAGLAGAAGAPGAAGADPEEATAGAAGAAAAGAEGSCAASLEQAIKNILTVSKANIAVLENRVLSFILTSFQI